MLALGNHTEVKIGRLTEFEKEGVVSVLEHRKTAAQRIAEAEPDCLFFFFLGNKILHMYRKNFHVSLKLFDIHSYFVLGIGSLKQLFVTDLGGMEEMICWKLK